MPSHSRAKKPVDGEHVWMQDSRIVGSEGFRGTFYAAALRLGVRFEGVNKPIKYVVEREKHSISNSHVNGYRLPSLGLRSLSLSAVNVPAGAETDFLFLASDFSLPAVFSQPFPLYLPRPEYMAVPKESIKVVDRFLANAHVSYVRDTLADDTLGPSMFQATQKYKTKDSNSPKEMRIVVSDPSLVGPTHMLAVHGRAGATTKSQVNLVVSMFPVHSLVLAANCAKLAPFPPQIVPTEGVSGEREFTLPIVSIFPSSHVDFPHLLEYIYLKRPGVIFARILRLVSPAVIPPPEEQENLARYLAGSHPPPQLSEVLHTLTGVWDNACCLGVYDDELWDVFDIIRKVVLMAMAIRHGRLDTLESIKTAAAALGREREPARAPRGAPAQAPRGEPTQAPRGEPSRAPKVEEPELSIAGSSDDDTMTM